MGIGGGRMVAGVKELMSFTLVKYVKKALSREGKRKGRVRREENMENCFLGLGPRSGFWSGRRQIWLLARERSSRGHPMTQLK